MMDLNPSLNSSGFFQAIITHSATLAVSVSPLRPNGLNDLDIWMSASGAHLNGLWHTQMFPTVFGDMLVLDKASLLK